MSKSEFKTPACIEKLPTSSSPPRPLTSGRFGLSSDVLSKFLHSAREEPTVCCGPPQPCGEDGSAEHPSAVIRSGAGRAPGQSPANTGVKLLIRPLDDSCHSAGGNVSFFTQQSPTGLHPDLTASSGQTYSYEGAVRY